MSESSIPVQSIATLVKASVVATVLAVVLLVSVILPAEYDIDPLGIGGGLGLTVLAAPAQEVASEPAKESLGESGLREDEAIVFVPANQGVEYKFILEQHEKLNFEWYSDGTPLYFDFHGEPKGDTTGYFESYSIATADRAQGTVSMPFDGSHGWYWKNTTNSPVTVILKTKGNYEVVGLIQ